MSIRKETCLGMLVIALVFCLMTGVHAGYEQTCSAEDYKLATLVSHCTKDIANMLMTACQGEARQKRSPFTSYAAAHRFLRRKRSEEYSDKGVLCECCINQCTTAELLAHCDSPTNI
ncbi:bombyxin A-2 homolog [Watersipora subatra]|uniref:bombyxin A-2 homolog n=1 Tax=Watersipora subatra TaxID=2589382 RepID=UPI00355BC988